MHEAASPDDNLPHCALLMARVAYPELDPSPFLRQLQQMGATARDHLEIGLGGSPPRRTRLRIVTEFVFGQLGFVGNHEQYDDPRNSLLNDVLSRRTGIPITLAVVFIDVARRAGLAVEGVNFPGHFLVRCLPDAGDRGRPARRCSSIRFTPARCSPTRSARACCAATSASRPSLEPGMLRTATKRDILLRMLLNLKRAYVRLRSLAQAHAVTELLVALDPSALDRAARPRAAGLATARLRRGATRSGDLAAAGADLARTTATSAHRSGTMSKTCAGGWRR